MQVRDPELNRLFSEALRFLAFGRCFSENFIFRGLVRLFLFSFFQTDLSFASESQSSSRSLSQADACNKVLTTIGALKGERASASDLDYSVDYEWLQPPVPKGFWNEEANQKAYMKWLGEKLGYTKPEDWFGLTQKLIEANSGVTLLNKKFKGSPAEMVMALADQAPEGGWRPWLFGGVPKGFWDEEANQKAYMKWLGEKLGYTKPEDWFGLTKNLIKANRGGWLLGHKFQGSPAEIVMSVLADQAPEGGWKKDQFYDTSKMEGRMRQILSRWFDGLFKPSFNNRKTHGLKFKDSGRGMEADVLFDELKLAIEYHGRQHYAAADNWGGREAFEKTQKRDQEKREAFKREGYVYIEIAHFDWIDGSEETLKSLILKQLKEFEANTDFEVKDQAWFIQEALHRITIN